ncbi:hypothetical protein ElyMa_006842300 [Elysia marginata]|uniref:Uncharacterized protein n=1 Tax=Elysia marginata TaxID=1093978 RepID=A0AAV4JA30_9GAST|nr:hypothetical protein ElyMa_006842300 [Elysia marginata]
MSQTQNQISSEDVEPAHFRLLWIPPRLKLESIRKILELNLEENDVVLERPTDAIDASRVDVSIPMRDVSGIPHYSEVEVKVGNRTEKNLWFVSVLGLKQSCHCCGDTSHWPVKSATV